ncbi:Pentatricopeptide repeat-containing protein At1g74600, chloroplastic [Linum perenne]
MVPEFLARLKIFPQFLARLKSSLAAKGNAISGTNLNPLLPALDSFHGGYTKSPHLTLQNTRILHAHLLEAGLLPSNLFVANYLLRCYGKFEVMVDAVKLFNTIPEPNVISWNTMISSCNGNFRFEDSWRLFCRMHISGFQSDEITYGSVLSACGGLLAPGLGEQVYSFSIKNGFCSSGYVCAGMIDLFAKTDRLEDAFKVFYSVNSANVVCWNSIISGSVRSGQNLRALHLFQQMGRECLMPNSFTFSSVLTACVALADIHIGKGVHGWVIKCGSTDVFVGTAIIDLYAKCGDMEEALKEFKWMPVRNVVSWTAIISGFVKRDDSLSALKIFRQMRELKERINNFTITSVLTSCAKPNMFKEAIQLHCWIVKAGYYLDGSVSAALISMYSKLGSLDQSEMLFTEMDKVKNSGIWAVMISSLAQSQNSQRAVDMFCRMLQEDQRPDNYCYSSVLSVINCLHLGSQIHCHACKFGFVYDLSVGSSLFTMYSKNGSIEDSYKVFQQIPFRDSVSWTSMIAGFAEHGRGEQALSLFMDMISGGNKPDQNTLTAALTACSVLQSLRKGREIHGYAFRAGLGSEELISSALVCMYSKSGALAFASKVFDLLPQKDQVSCSSLVSGYAQNGLLEEAVVLFQKMFVSNFIVDSFTVSSALGAIALLNRLELGMQVHTLVTKLGLASELSVGSSLVTMYSECGIIANCSKAFDQIVEPDHISWTSLIASYARHGKGEEALEVYEHMIRKGTRPDAVTFVEVLSACSHTDLVEKGDLYFSSMTRDFGIEPDNRHYACMVDLLGRSGRLKEAESFINSMPIDPDSLVWTTLLAACKLHGDIDLGKKAAEKAMELAPGRSGSYISLSNMFAEVGKWKEAVDVRRRMSIIGVNKEPGWSFT